MSVSGADLVRRARDQIGKPYVFGAEGPDSFDCSGLMQYVYKAFGLTLPRTTFEQVKVGQAVDRGQIQPGDLIFSSWDGKPHSHVGMYSGAGTIINAPHRGSPVREAPLTDSYWAHVDGIRRMPGVTGGPATAEAPGGGGGLPLVPRIVSGGITEAIDNVGNALAGIATSAASMSRVADAVTRLFLPTNIMRGALGLGGAVFVLIGIYFLSREVRA